MKTRASDPNFPQDMAFHFIWAPIAVVSSMIVSQVVFNRGWPWLAAYGFGVILAVVGGFQMFRAKLPFYRQGRFFTFGTRGMDVSSKKLYFSALRWLAVGCVLCLLLLAARF